jgi:serine/threonine-protein kinase
MAAPNLLRRRTTSNPVRGGLVSTGAGMSLPSDVLAQTCRRVFAVGVAFAVLWAVALVAFLLLKQQESSMNLMPQEWLEVGPPIAATGLAVSLLLVVLAMRFSPKPDLLLDMGSAFLITTCLLFGLLEFWVPRFDIPHSHWLGISILAYSSIVPSTPANTLRVGLLAATMGPLALIITRMRGVQFEATAFKYVLAFLPAYLCAFFAVIPARIIRQLGQQVRKARELGSYRLEELLGKGGMGEVYKASHQLLARHAAVKLIRAESLGSSDPAHARVLVERFRREAEAAASLRSPHTISLYDFGVAHDGTFFFVMELLDGLDLESLVQKFGPLDPARVVYLLRQACESLEEAHVRGLIHRDIKPSNIFTCRMGLAVDFVKVLDFGLVKSEQDHASDVRLTAPNHTTGTPAYMAPEAVLGTGPVDHRVDIYALGCVAYWLLTGQLVFEGGNSMQQLLRHAHDLPVPPSQRSELAIPASLDQVVLACLAKHPDQRPQSAGEVGRRLLDAIPEGERWTDERAEHWWQRHRPESARPTPTCCDGLTLTKLEAQGWAAPADSPAEAGLAEAVR